MLRVKLMWTMFLCHLGSIVEGSIERVSNIQNNFSLLADGYWGFHRGKPVPFADRAPSWIFQANLTVLVFLCKLHD